MPTELTDADVMQPGQPAAPPAELSDEDVMKPAAKSLDFIPGLEGTTAANPQVAAQWTANELRSKDNAFIKYPLVAAGTLQTFASGMVKQIADAFKTAHGAAMGQPQSLLEDEISAGLVAAGGTSEDIQLWTARQDNSTDSQGNFRIPLLILGLPRPQAMP